MILTWRSCDEGRVLWTISKAINAFATLGVIAAAGVAIEGKAAQAETTFLFQLETTLPGEGEAYLLEEGGEWWIVGAELVTELCRHYPCSGVPFLQDEYPPSRQRQPI